MVFTKLVQRILECGEIQNITFTPDAFWLFDAWNTFLYIIV